MTPDEKDKWIALIEGVAAGGQLQYKDFDGEWVGQEGLNFNVNLARYRIKPEPRVAEAWVHPHIFSSCPDAVVFPSGRDLGDRVRVRITEILE